MRRYPCRPDGDIGLFKITTEGGVASGVRRIEAVTGEGALNYIHSLTDTLERAAVLLKTGPESVLSKIEQVSERLRISEREVDALKMRLATAAGGDLLDDVVEVAGVQCLLASLDGRIQNRSVTRSIALRTACPKALLCLQQSAMTK